MTAYGAGELDQVVTFKRESSAPDGMGGQVLTLTTIACCSALVRPLTGKEQERADSIQASTGYFIVIRYRDDIKANDVAIWRGRRLNVRNVRDKGPRALYLEIDAEAGVPT